MFAELLFGIIIITDVISIIYDVCGEPSHLVTKKYEDYSEKSSSGVHLINKEVKLDEDDKKDTKKENKENYSFSEYEIRDIVEEYFLGLSSYQQEFELRQSLYYRDLYVANDKYATARNVAIYAGSHEIFIPSSLEDIARRKIEK